MNKQLTISWIFIILTGMALAQEKKPVTVSKAAVEFYGFIRSEFYHDTYKGLNAAQDNFYLFPVYKGQDGNGEDLNQQGITGYTAMATRFGMNISGPEILGAKSSANFETDFAGIVSCYPEVLRLRKAYVKLDWDKTSLLVGQTWHPLWNGSGSFYPQVGGLNTGSPYNPFNRSPQVDLDYRTGKITLSITALYEQQYASKGFYESTNTNSSNLAKRNAGIPELVAGIYYNSNGLSLGVAGQFNAIQPIDITEGTEGKFKTEELNTSMIGMGYVGYKKDKLFVLAKGIIGQNMANLLMTGGYGVKDYNEATGAMTYTNYTNYSSLFNIVYGAEYQFGFFAGISGNLGTSDALYNFDGEAKTLGLMPNLKQVYRVAPYFAYNYKNLRFVAEYELDSADYGAGNFNFADGLYDSTVNAINHRFLLMLMYNF